MPYFRLNATSMNAHWISNHQISNPNQFIHSQPLNLSKLHLQISWKAQNTLQVAPKAQKRWWCQWRPVTVVMNPPSTTNLSKLLCKWAEKLRIHQNQHRNTLDVEHKHWNAFSVATSLSMEGLFGYVNPPSAMPARFGDGGEEWGGENGEGAVYVFPRAERPVSSARARVPGLRARVPGTLSSSPPLARAGHPRCVWKGGWSAGRVGVAGAGAARLRVLAGAAEGGKVQRGARGSPKLAPPLTRSFLRFECIPWELISALGSWIRRH